MFKR
jgi:hypothetical protein